MTLRSPSPAVLDILAALVGFDTTSHKSNLDCIGWIEAFLSRHGVASERFPDATGEKASLFATIGPAGPDGYVLSGHTDVVPVEGQDWSSDPFVLRIADGRAYGRGALDMKGFLACVLAAVPAMTAARLKKPIHLAFSYDEEIGCVGVVPMLEHLAERGFRAAGAFIGEPTEMGVVVGHKGKISVRADVTGFSCHSSRAPEGVNAVEYGARLVAHIQSVAARLAQNGARDEAYDVPFSTFQTSVFHGGVQVNVIPHHARLDFEARVIAGDDRHALVEEARTFARETLELEMKAARPDTGIVFTVTSDTPTLETEPDAPVATMAMRLAGSNRWSKVAFGTEAAHFAAILKTPSVVVGPGSIEQAHKPDEFIALSQLSTCEAFLGRLVAELSA